MAEKNITLTIGGTEYPFRVTTTEYNAYINDITPDNKVSPSKNFIRRCLVEKKQMETIVDLCDQGLGIEIAGKLIEEFHPKLEIEVKK